MIVNVLDFVGPWLQFFAFEDGRGVAGRSEGHGQNEHDNGGAGIGRGVVHCRAYTYVLTACTRHTFCTAGSRMRPEGKTEPHPNFVSATLRLESMNRISTNALPL